MGVRQGDMPVTTMGGFSRFGGGGNNKVKTGIRGGSWDGKRGDDPHGVSWGYGMDGGYSSSRDRQRFSWSWE